MLKPPGWGIWLWRAELTLLQVKKGAPRPRSLGPGTLASWHTPAGESAVTSPLSVRTGISGLGLLSLGCRHCGCAKGQRFPGEAEDTRRPAQPPLVCADAALSPAPLPGHSQCRAWTGTFLIPGSGGAKTESQDGCGIGLNGPFFPRLMARPQPLEMQWGGGCSHTQLGAS